MRSMNQPHSSEKMTHLSESDYLRLRKELSVQLRREVRRSGRQHMFAIGLQAALMVFFSVMLFIGARRYHDMMLWAIGFCLLVLASLNFLELDFLFSGHSWMDIFQRKKSKSTSVSYPSQD